MIRGISLATIFTVHLQPSKEHHEKTILALLALSLVAFVSCKKDEGPGPAGRNPDRTGPGRAGQADVTKFVKPHAILDTDFGASRSR